MQISENALDFGKMQIAAMAAVAASIFIWTFFLNLSGITVNDFFTFKIDIILGKLLTINFLLFLLTFPMTGAIIAAFAKKMDGTNLAIFAMISGFIALTIAMLAFAPMQGFLIITVFYLISIPFMIQAANASYLELKKFVSTRTFMASVGKGITIIGIGLFVLSAATILPQQEQYIEKFEETFFENIFQSLMLGENKNQIVNAQVEIVIQTQQQTLDKVTDNQLFEKLRGKQDMDVMAFVAGTDALKKQIKSPEYRQQVSEQMNATAGRATEQIDIMKMMKQQFPFIEITEKFFWLFQSFVLVSVFFLLANIFCKPMAAVYGLITEKALALGEKRQPTNN